MPYSLTRADLTSITEPELAFSTDRLLPAWDDIPNGFKDGNIYTEIAEAMFFGTSMPKGDLILRKGFDDADVTGQLFKCLSAHLQSMRPKHEHKIAGVGFMIAQTCEIVSASVAS